MVGGVNAITPDKDIKKYFTELLKKIISIKNIYYQTSFNYVLKHADINLFTITLRYNHYANHKFVLYCDDNQIKSNLIQKYELKVENTIKNENICAFSTLFHNFKELRQKMAHINPSILSFTSQETFGQYNVCYYIEVQK